MSVRPLNLALSRPPRPAPAYMWPLALAVAFAGGLAVTSPKLAVLMLGGGVILWVVRAIVVRPLNGFLVALCVFPFYSIFRGVCGMYDVPVPLSLIGMWPEVVLLCMLFGLIVSAVRGGTRLSLTWYDAPMVVLLASGAYGFILSMLEGDLSASLYGLHASVTPICFYFLARWIRPSVADLKRVLRYWLVGFALLAVASLYDYLVRPDFFVRVAIQVRDGFWGKFEPHFFFRWYPRMQSLLFAEQTWGTVCALVSLYCLSRIRSARTRAEWWCLLGVFTLAMIGVVFSMSRGAYACWLVGVAVMVCFPGRHRRAIGTTLLLGALSLFIAILILGHDERVSSLVTRTVALTDSKNEVAYERVNQWQRVLQNFPLFPAGRGLGRAGAQAMYHGTGDGGDFVPDGGYFRILAEQGIPGILLFAIGSLGLIAALMRALWAARGLDRALCLTALSTFCGLLVQNIGGNIFDLYFLPQLFWMLVGFAMGRFLTRAAEPAT